MADLDLCRLNIDQLTELVGKARSDRWRSRESSSAGGPPERARISVRCRRLQARRHLPGGRDWRHGRTAASVAAGEVSEPAERRRDFATPIARYPKWVQAIIARAVWIDSVPKRCKVIPLYQVVA